MEKMSIWPFMNTHAKSSKLQSITTTTLGIPKDRCFKKKKKKKSKVLSIFSKSVSLKIAYHGTHSRVIISKPTYSDNTSTGEVIAGVLEGVGIDIV